MTPVSDAAQSGAHAARVIRVASPTGHPAVDRANIEAAIARARPGDVVEFGAGTYALGRAAQGPIEVPVPGLVLRGHPSGGGGPATTIRGAAVHDDGSPVGLLLDGGHQTVRDLDFVSFGLAIILVGGEAGYRVEHARFRRSLQALLALLPGVPGGIEISRNQFIDVGFPAAMQASFAHFAENTITAPDPELVPILGQPGDVADLACNVGTCVGNVFEDNVVRGIADGIFIAAFPGGLAKDNIIRRNRFTGQRVFTDLDFGSMAAVFNFGGKLGANRIVDNTLNGSEGLGILLQGASRVIIEHNTVTDVTGSPLLRPKFRGVGIFLDEGSDRNRLLENTFKDNAGHDIVLRGNHNLVVARGPTSVLDRGRDNDVVQESSRPNDLAFRQDTGEDGTEGPGAETAVGESARLKVWALTHGIIARLIAERSAVKAAAGDRHGSGETGSRADRVLWH